MHVFRALIAVGIVLPGCLAQRDVGKEIKANCDQTETTARAYLSSRGFTEPECPACLHDPHSLKAPKALLDAEGKKIGTLRIRRELVDKVPFWIWSSPLHARVFISTKSEGSGCRLGLWIDFNSLHTMVVGIIPTGERLGLPSNGRLESDYLQAIQAKIEGNSGSGNEVGQHGDGQHIPPR